MRLPHTAPGLPVPVEAGPVGAPVALSTGRSAPTQLGTEEEVGGGNSQDGGPGRPWPPGASGSTSSPSSAPAPLLLVSYANKRSPDSKFCR
jgi:hypothetical protein